MSSHRFKNGAFVFTRARGVEPRAPEELEPLLAKHGIRSEFVPQYPGDRAAVGRAFAAAKSGLSKDGLLLRPIKRSATELVYGVVKETPDVVDQRIDHEFEAVISWSAEPDPSAVRGDHVLAVRVAAFYRDLRGKITSDDWSGAISSYLDQHDAARVRSDGRIFWVPPQRIEPIRRLAAFLEEIGIDLILCELEPEVRTVVQGVARENLEEQLSRLQAEVAAFDGKQRPSTYARRLDEFQKLRERALLYRDALGMGVDQAEQVLAELEDRVEAMFELRTSTGKRELAAPAKLSSLHEATINFAGAEFAYKGSADDCEVFVSDDQVAQDKIATLERMGVAGRWQKLGGAEVRIANSGPVGERVSIRIRVPEGRTVRDCAQSLSVIGIQVVGYPEVEK